MIKFLLTFWDINKDRLRDAGFYSYPIRKHDCFCYSWLLLTSGWRLESYMMLVLPPVWLPISLGVAKKNFFFSYDSTVLISSYNSGPLGLLARRLSGFNMRHSTFIKWESISYWPEKVAAQRFCKLPNYNNLFLLTPSSSTLKVCNKDRNELWALVSGFYKK